MILRRITQHVKAQNWTAVALDFVIVVIGVFIGIQVANWNENRGDRELEREYLNRLHEEIEFSIATNKATVNAESTRLAQLKEVGEYLKNESAASLDPKHCLALYQSHIFIRDVIAVPAIDELKSIGRVVLISDGVLRSAIIRFDQFNIEATALLENIRGDRLVLSRKHPNLIKMDPTDIYGEHADCQYLEMRQSQMFINDFTDNFGRFRAYSDLILSPQHEMLESLHSEIDRVLEFKHEVTIK